MLKRRRAPKSGIARPDAPIRSAAHLQWVRGFECVAAKSGACSGKVQACHVRTGAGAGMGQKPGDDMTYPGCAGHHAEQHRIGEPAFERAHAINLRAIAERLAAQSPALKRLAHQQRMLEEEIMP